jgi:hypothetical protein
MAIRRCPYCKAIIDEQDKYCNNCGTQLLFPEDELVEEPIPGDKIVEEDETKEEEREEEKLEEGEEPEETESVAEEVEAAEEEEKEKEEIEEEEEKDDDSGKLEELEEEKEEEEVRLEEEAKEEAEDLLEPEAEEEAEEEWEEDLEEEIEEPSEEITTGEPIGKAALVDEPHKKYKVSIEEDELVFKTKELDNLTDTVVEGKEKLEGEEQAPTTKEILPPWARGMKEQPPHPADLEKREKTETTGAIESETTPTRPEWTTDSGIGIPEKVTQAGLPFGAAAVPATAEEREAVAEEKEAEEAGAQTRQQAGFSLKLKSKLVDLVFITALWLISLWFTAQVIGVSFFRLIVGSPVPVLAFYFILLLLYFFLFLYFLGETLGDHYFSEED